MRGRWTWDEEDQEWWQDDEDPEFEIISHELRKPLVLGSDGYPIRMKMVGFVKPRERWEED